MENSLSSNSGSTRPSKSLQTGKHSSRMCTARLLTVCASIVPDVSAWRRAQVNKFEKFSSLGHQMLLAGERAMRTGIPIW